METLQAGPNAFCFMILSQVYGSQGVECGSLDVIAPHNVIGSGTVRRWSFVGVGMAL